MKLDKTSVGIIGTTIGFIVGLLIKTGVTVHVTKNYYMYKKPRKGIL